MFGRGRIKDGVRGEAKVLELGPTAKGARQTAKRDVEYRFLLDVDGRRVEHVEPLPALKAPLAGDVLPVTVGSERLRIEWAEVPDIADRARASAAAAQAGDAAGAAAALGFTLRDEHE
jgi:hypothetical protein